MKKQSNSLKKVNTCAVVITFHPDLNIFTRLHAVAEEVNQIIVVDNGSNKEEIEILLKLKKEIKNLELILNSENLGIAKALNIGVRLAQELKYDWVLTLDQDSLISKGYIASISTVYNKFEDSELIMSLCPVITPYKIETQENLETAEQKIYSQSGKLIDTEIYYSIVKTAITSGNLVKVKVFDKIGFFDEEYFIDYVDHEFNLRLSKKGFKLVQCNKTILFHNVGEPKKHYFLGKTFTTTNHNSLRRYYYFRNCISTYKKYFFSDFKWVIHDLIYLSYIFIKIIFFEENRSEKLKFSLTGLRHGITGKMGEFKS
jgi:rhamnosyltransferase